MSKKSFKDSNPALQFISVASQEEEAANTDNTQNTLNTFNTSNLKKERKSKRLNLLLQPSVVEKVEKIATMKRTSLNDLINTLLKEFISREAETLSRYDEVFGN
jgi:predicted HicB family RNase H-like nuclease